MASPSPFTTRSTRRWWILLRRHPSALLLLAQLACVMLYPFVEETHAARILVGAFGVLILLLALRMIGHTSARLWPGVVLAAAAVVLSTLYIGFGIERLLPWQAALEAVFYFYAAGSLVSYMLADQRATTDELYAAGATLTLLVWAFTYLLVLCQAWQPGAFGGAVDIGAPRAWTDLMFLSFALFTSTGIGDVIPLSPLARAVASLEMFAGVMYLALVVSRLIGLSVAQRRD
jgi:hypothetical protein